MSINISCYQSEPLNLPVLFPILYFLSAPLFDINSRAVKFVNAESNVKAEISLIELQLAAIQTCLRTKIIELLFFLL